MSTTATSGWCSRTACRERRGVTDRRAHLHAGLHHQPGESLAEQRGVVGDHDAHGNTASTLVPCGSTSETRSEPPTAATRSASPWRPLPEASAAPTPSSRTSTQSAVRRPAHLNGDLGRRRSASRRSSPPRRPRTRPRSRGRTGSARPRRRSETARGALAARSATAASSPPPARAAGCSPAARVAQLLHGGLQVRDGAVGLGDEHVAVAVEPGRLQLQGDGEQPLLRTVVQVALDATTLLEVGGRQPGP